MVRLLLTGVGVLGIIIFFLTGSVTAAGDTDPGACDLERLAFMPKAEDIERIEALLDQGANVNGKCGGNTPLVKACVLPRDRNESIIKIKLVQLLLEKGADPNIPDYAGSTPLINLLRASPYIGGGEDLVAVVKLLLNAGAGVNARDKQGNSALMLGLKNSNKEVFQLFKTRSRNERQSAPPPGPGAPEGESPK